jgi:hypothetical protein
MLLPIALDLFLWLGPRLSIEPVARQIIDWYGRQVAVAVEAGSPMVLTPEQLRGTLGDILSSFNLFSVVALNVAGLPSFMAGQAASRPAAAEVNNVVVLLGLAVLLGLGGLLPGAAFLVTVGQEVRSPGKTPETRLLYTQILRIWLYLVAFVVGAILLGFIIALPISAVLSVAVMISQALGAVLIFLTGALLQVVFFASIVYLYFLVDAIVISQVHPVRAAWFSIVVVGRNFWPSVGLILASFVILAGTQVIWSRLLSPQLGPLPGILGNAYIASGLTAASMLFYRSRLAITERQLP